MSMLTARNLEEHDELYWWALEDRIKSPSVMVNFDAHSDLAMFDGNLGIGNFISRMVYDGMMDELVWVKGEKSLDFKNGVYNFNIGKKNESSTSLVCDFKSPFYFLSESYVKTDRLVEPRPFVVTVIDLDCQFPKLGDKNWFLSVDHDFFSCRNPKIVGKRKVSQKKKEKFDEILATGLGVREKEEWDAFLREAEERFPGIKGFAEKNLLPEYTSCKESIKSKILKANSLLLGKLSYSKCLGLYGVNSLSSGFVDADKHICIDECVRQWLSFLAGNMNKLKAGNRETK